MYSTSHISLDLISLVRDIPAQKQVIEVGSVLWHHVLEIHCRDSTRFQRKPDLTVGVKIGIGCASVLNTYSIDGDNQVNGMVSFRCRLTVEGDNGIIREEKVQILQRLALCKRQSS